MTWFADLRFASGVFELRNARESVLDLGIRKDLLLKSFRPLKNKSGVMRML